MSSECKHTVAAGRSHREKMKYLSRGEENYRHYHYLLSEITDSEGPNALSNPAVHTENIRDSDHDDITPSCRRLQDSMITKIISEHR